MNKKLLAVAVAGAFTAAPLAAFAQSTVTISGFFSVSVEDLSIGNFGGSTAQGVAARNGTNKSEGRLSDNSSRVVFNIVEDLGGGLRAVAQADLRFNSANNSTGLPPMSGNTHVGLRGSWGQIRAGLQDLHYGVTESYIADRGDLRLAPFSLLAFAGGGGQAIANTTRTPNTVFYDAPELWGGFSGRIAYSFSPFNTSTSATGVSGFSGLPVAGPGVGVPGASIPTAASADIGVPGRHGGAWNINPNWSANGLNLSYSYWRSKWDDPTAFASATSGADQRSDRLAGSYLFPMGFRIGLAWDRSKLTSSATFGAVASGTQVSNRTAWLLPMSYTWGPSEIHVFFSKAGNDKDAGNGAIAAGAQTGASMFAASYVYNLSKRTNVALGYGKINNKANATYNLFQSVGLGGSTDAGLKQGEKPQVFSVTMRHAF